MGLASNNALGLSEKDVRRLMLNTGEKIVWEEKENYVFVWYLYFRNLSFLSS